MDLNANAFYDRNPHPLAGQMSPIGGVPNMGALLGGAMGQMWGVNQHNSAMDFQNRKLGLLQKLLGGMGFGESSGSIQFGDNQSRQAGQGQGGGGFSGSANFQSGSNFKY